MWEPRQPANALCRECATWRLQRFAIARPLASLLVLSLLFSGCGPKSDRMEVSGRVTLDGEPLDSASIRFTSLGGKLNAAGALIQDGAYLIPQEKGLPPGTYHLEISAADNDAPPVMYHDASGKPGTLTQPERIPPEYNLESQQKVEVTADGENKFDFDIVSRRAQ